MGLLRACPGDAEMALVDFTDDLVLPAPREREIRVQGYPEGSQLNFVSWSDDSKHIAFTVRSAGQSPCLPPVTPQPNLDSCLQSQAMYLCNGGRSCNARQNMSRLIFQMVRGPQNGLSAGGLDDPPRIPLELWVAEVATGKSRRLLSSPEQGLNCVFDK